MQMVPKSFLKYFSKKDFMKTYCGAFFFIFGLQCLEMVKDREKLQKTLRQQFAELKN